MTRSIHIMNKKQKLSDEIFDKLMENDDKIFDKTFDLTADGHGLNATLGDTKKDLYYQIQFYLDMKDAEKRLKGKRY